MGASASADALKKKDDGYEPPSGRARARLRPAPAQVLADPDVAAFDPTADKYDYLIVFATERRKRRKEAMDDPEAFAEEAEDEDDGDKMSWADVELTWFQAIPGEEEKKAAGAALLKRDWEETFGKVDDPRRGEPRAEVLKVAREHVVDLLARRSGLQLKLSLPSDGARRVYCQVRAPISLLERTADARRYKFKFRDEVDPGAAFWRRSSGVDRRTGRPVYDEIVEEQALYEREEAAETLDALYRAGRIGPTDMAIFADAEPTKKHWSRRIRTLERIVDRVPCANPYPAYAPFDDAPKERHLYDEYPSVRGRTLFLPKDRLYLTKSIVDEVFDFGVLRERGIVEGFLALHDANYGEMPTTDWLQKRWVFFWNGEADRCGAPYLTHPAMLRGRRCPCHLRPWAQPLAEVRSYYGEKVALYFAWLAFYGYYLMLPAVFCLGAQLYVAATSVDDEDRGLHYDQFAVAAFLVTWSAYYKESWDVESQYCAVRWGTRNFEEDEVDRPQFRGDEDQPRRVSPITNQNETYYPAAKRQRTQALSACVVALSVGVLVFLILLIFELEYFFEYELHGTVFYALGESMSLVQSILIQVMSYFYGKAALYLNELENYQTQTAYENNLIIKKFSFELFNNYSALAITAFIKGTVFECTDDDCLSDLQELLYSIMATRYAMNAVAAFSAPLKRLAERLVPAAFADEGGAGDASDDEADAGDGPPAEAPRFEAELKLDEFEGMFDDYCEIVLQMGLVSMFTLGWYLVPLLGAGEILLQIRVDAHKLTALSQRPDPTPAESVGSWGVLMESMGFLAVFANAGIVVFTTKSLSAYSSLQRAIVFFVLEQVLLALKVLVHAAIDDEPRELAELKKRQAHVVDRHKNVVFDDDGEEGAGGADAVAVDADALSVAALRTDRMTRPALRRLEYLRRKLLLCDKEVRDLRSQHRRATAAERYREDLGVSYSRENPDLALGLVNVRVEAAEGLGSARDPVDAAATRVVVHVRDLPGRPEGSPPAGPAPQVSRPARRPAAGPGGAEPGDEHGARIVFDQHFSVAPVRTSRAELHVEIVDDAKKLRRGFARVPLADLADQTKHALDLPVQRPGVGGGGRPATLRVVVQFQYSKVVPIQNRIFELVDEQRRLHRDVTNLQIGKEVEFEDDWDFPDKRDLGGDDAKDDDDGGDDDASAA